MFTSYYTLYCIVKIINTSPVVTAGESNLGLYEPGEGAGVQHDVVLVHGAVQTDTAHHEVDREVCQLTDWTGEADTSLVGEFTTCSNGFIIRIFYCIVLTDVKAKMKASEDSKYLKPYYCCPPMLFMMQSCWV